MTEPKKREAKSAGRRVLSKNQNDVEGKVSNDQGPLKSLKSSEKSMTTTVFQKLDSRTSHKLLLINLKNSEGNER
jgi:hypothetical protein